ncbi:MAG: hypothetical protein EHM18_15340 [Acidobacteria bacterium]|nr:MAG: hypothetical protein EHM18_15340 [Acidobacteriota bacterium]
MLSRRELNCGFENGVRATLSEPPTSTTTAPCTRLLVWGSPVSVNPSRVFLSDTQADCVDSFETLPTTFGLNLTTLRLPSGQAGIAVAPGPLNGYPPLIGIFDLQGRKIGEFFAFNDPNTYGSNIAAVDVDGDSQDEIVLGEGIGPGRPYTVRIFRQDGQMLTKWEAF